MITGRHRVTGTEVSEEGEIKGQFANAAQPGGKQGVWGRLGSWGAVMSSCNPSTAEAEAGGAT